MATGTEKVAVLAPYYLKSKRVLVVAPTPQLVKVLVLLMSSEVFPQTCREECEDESLRVADDKKSKLNRHSARVAKHRRCRPRRSHRLQLSRIVNGVHLRNGVSVRGAESNATTGACRAICRKLVSNSERIR
jgi:hypothetical protein